MLPRSHRPHDQLLRPTLIAGIGGLVVGHILWLIGISIATDGQDVSFWVLILSAVIAVLAESNSQRDSGSRACAGSNPSSGCMPFISQNRAAFQIFVMKPR